jgi:serine/threonine protein kinase
VRQLHKYQAQQTGSNSKSKDLSEDDGDDKSLVIKLIDFGFSITCEKKSRQFCGTPSYMAPEIVKKIDYEAKGTDIWAIGVLLYRMLYGDPPFKAPSEKELYGKILKANLEFPTTIPASKL